MPWNCIFVHRYKTQAFKLGLFVWGQGIFPNSYVRTVFVRVFIVGEEFPLPYYNVGTDVLGCPIVVLSKSKLLFK